MGDLFGVDVPGLVADNIFAAGNLFDVTLIHYTAGVANPTTGKLSTQATGTTYTVQGFRDDSFTGFDGPTRKGNMVVGISQHTSTWSATPIEPLAGDKVTVNGISGTVQEVQQDPAQATYFMDCLR